jgi:hypothetical protein
MLYETALVIESAVRWGPIGDAARRYAKRKIIELIPIPATYKILTSIVESDYKLAIRTNRLLWSNCNGCILAHGTTGYY